MTLAIESFTTYEETVNKALDLIGAKKVLAEQQAVLIKPNLINDAPHPVTTPAKCCEAVIRYVRNCSHAEIVIGEGCGDSRLETDDVFKRLGYDSLAKKYQVALIDLNHASLVKKSCDDCSVFNEMILPEIAFSHFLISVPVLKAHSLATITGTLKNMIGFAPPRHYSGRYGSWKKALFHGDMQQTILDLNRYILPDLTVMDATIGLADFHLGGNTCSPPINKIVAGFNPYEVDRQAAAFLGFDWRDILHLHNPDGSYKRVFQ